MNLPPLFAAGYAALALVIYVVLDGFDLGVGILLLFQQTKASRDHMIDSITPTWDGNETWLIMAGITLFACFPIAYGILLPALYLPVIVMLLALGLRGVSFEFRVQSKQHHQAWDTVFATGSAIAAFTQGVILGSLLDGIHTDGMRFAGSVLDIFRPLSLLSGLTLVVGYIVLGSGWLHLKANSSIQRFSTDTLRAASVSFGVLFCVACLYASRTSPGVTSAWSAHPMILSVMSCLFVVFSGCLVSAAGKARLFLPFALGISQFVVGMIGISLIIYPTVVPFQVSIWEAAAPNTTQIFLLTGAAIVAPVVIAYSAFAYWVFRGRTPAKGWE
jgi:cytochrome d ubiquinol oxidase subunit II